VGKYKQSKLENDKIKGYLSSDDIEMKELGLVLIKKLSMDEQIALLKQTIKPPFGCKMTVDLFDGDVDFKIYKDFSPDHAYKFVIKSHGKKEYFPPTEEASL